MLEIKNLLKPNDLELKELTNVLEPENQEESDSFTLFWKEWFDNTIPGDKVTLICKSEDQITAVIRFWSSPFIENKWIIEGLYVKKEFRKHGIGEKLILEGLDILKQFKVNAVSAHIRETNAASRALFTKLGFIENTKFNKKNSFGEIEHLIKEFALQLEK